MAPLRSRGTTRQRAVKRGLDISLSLFALGLFAPVHAFSALWIKLEDGGALLFTQERVGEGSRAFRIYKLRTMRGGRVTRLGRWLRATGLDETPQFFNVLCGEMSIVGPRPLTTSDLQRLGWDRLHAHPRFDVPPGITGLGQIFGSGNPRQVRALDALYARVGSPLLDLRLIGLSFAMNIAGKARIKRWLRAARRRARRQGRADVAMSGQALDFDRLGGEA